MDVGDAAFSVPPQQLITHDGGIIEIGAEVTHIIMMMMMIIAMMIMIMTQCQDEVRILSGRTQKLKVAKRCWKQLNEHNLMYIYHKQCENMQKIQ